MIDVLKSLIQQFMPFAQQKMGFSRPPRLFIRQDEENAANPIADIKQCLAIAAAGAQKALKD